MATLPVSNLVNVQVNLTATPGQAQSLSNILIVGSSDVIDVTQRIRTYSTLSQVATDFGTSAPEYFAANEWFAQTPQPQSCIIGEWANTAIAGRLIGSVLSAVNQTISTWTSITNGGFYISVDGSSPEFITALNFSTATNLNGIAAIITSQLAGAATVTWNSPSQNFVIKSNTTGNSSAISFLTSPPSGTDISSLLGLTATNSGAYSVPGMAAESAVSAIALMDDNFGQQWYATFVIGASDADHLDIAEYIQGSNSKHAYGVNTQEGGILVSTDTSNIGYKLKALGFTKSVVQYSSNSEYAVVSLLARIMTTNYTANNTVITLMYKQEPGVVAENLSQSQMNALLANNANVFVNYDNNTAIIQPGVVSSGDFIDTIFGADWLAIDIQNTVYNLLYTTPTKIPQTNSGNNIITAGIISVLEQAVANGLVAPGTWTQTGFGTLNEGDYLPTGYYVYAPDIALQNPADRAARRSVTFQVAVKLAGAIHSVDVIVSINR